MNEAKYNIYFSITLYLIQWFNICILLNKSLFIYD